MHKVERHKPRWQLLRSVPILGKNFFFFFFFWCSPLVSFAQSEQPGGILFQTSTTRYPVKRKALPGSAAVREVESFRCGSGARPPSANKGNGIINVGRSANFAAASLNRVPRRRFHPMIFFHKSEKSFLHFRFLMQGRQLLRVPPVVLIYSPYVHHIVHFVVHNFSISAAFLCCFL